MQPLPALLLSLFVSLTSATYRLQDDYTPTTFASKFNFINAPDPTHGYVNYLSLPDATSFSLFHTLNNQIYLGVDSTTTTPSTARGRSSLRLESQAHYNHGLFILDLAHMPSSTCGTWPAFWLMNPTWPSNGEIDIIEGVNSQTRNSFAIHSASGCSITNTGNFAGQLHTQNCFVKAPNQAENAGCSIGSTNDQSYGSGFNTAGGGVYATEWTSDAISIWHFPRSAIPKDISSGSPDPKGWGLPTAQFAGDCDIDRFIRDQQIVFDISFCGDWAGNAWSTDPVCKTKAATCEEFVRDNPAAFAESYWLINGLKVYQSDGWTGETVGSGATGGTPTATKTSTSTSTTGTWVTKTVYASAITTLG